MRFGFWAVFLWLAVAGSAQAQTLGHDTLFVPGSVRQYQFHLDEPAERIENLRYDQSGEPLKGTLSPDGKRVVLDNYKKGQRIRFNAVFSDGRNEEIGKSPCFIDPIRYEL
jgi:hypothetical protein